MDGLISRQVYAEVPPRVEYRLTAMGRDAQGVLQAMADWVSAFAARQRVADVGTDQPG